MFEKTIYADLPTKFEAGTPNIADVIGLGEAIKYIQTSGVESIAKHEHELLIKTMQELKQFPGIKVLADNDHKAAVISFVWDIAHAHDIATILDENGVAVRAGHHCAMPLLQYLNVPACTRISFGMFNNLQDIAQLIDGLHKVNEIFA